MLLKLNCPFSQLCLSLVLVIHFPHISENSVHAQLSSVADQMTSSSECGMRHLVKSQEQVFKGQQVVSRWKKYGFTPKLFASALRNATGFTEHPNWSQVLQEQLSLLGLWPRWQGRFHPNLVSATQLSCAHPGPALQMT